MAKKVFLQESKEFQLRIDIAKCLGKGRRAPDPTDEAIFAAAVDAIRRAVASLGGGKAEVVADCDPIRREAIRYDTADRLLRANKLTLAVEALDKRTKLKCKRHDFIPELLFGKPARSAAYPDPKAAGVCKEHDATFKREQDIHLDNIKYCASGSLYVKGRQTADKNSSFFARYFPGLDALLPEPVPLQAISRWDETAFEDIDARWGRNEIDTWMLVNRRDAGKGTLLESELSFKIVKGMGEDWDRRALREASRLCLALKETGLFQELPPIFTLADPVSSIDIEKARKEGGA